MFVKLIPKFRKITNPDEVWLEWFSTDAFGVDKRLRQLYRALPRDPRCKFCLAPFEGVGATMVNIAFGKRRSALNPKFCNMCEEASLQFPGGNEVEMAMMFADIRGSTKMSEKMSPKEFSQLISRFYTGATKFINEEDGLVGNLAGDAVTGFWGAGFAGADYIRRAVDAAKNLAGLMSRQEIPVGISVHAGLAFFGVVGGVDGLTDITALGDEVNTAARLAAQAAAGEIIVSEAAIQKAGIDGSEMEARKLDLKGISQPVPVRVIQLL